MASSLGCRILYLFTPWTLSPPTALMAFLGSWKVWGGGVGILTSESEDTTWLSALETMSGLFRSLALCSCGAAQVRMNLLAVLNGTGMAWKLIAISVRTWVRGVQAKLELLCLAQP